MKRIVCIIIVLVLASPSFAQSAPTCSAGVFPKLPSSAVCTPETLAGVWKLLAVYEVPSAHEIELYTNRPLQYYVFEDDSRYGTYNSSLRDVTTKEVYDTALNQDGVMKQFSINKKGLVFFYKDRIAIDSLACFIVAKNDGPFEAGQMLLMPPEKAAKGRMVKVYQKIPF